MISLGEEVMCVSQGIYMQQDQVQLIAQLNQFAKFGLVFVDIQKLFQNIFTVLPTF